MTEARVVVGRIAGAFGVQGWVRVRSYTDPPDNIIDYQPWQVTTRDGSRPYTVASGRVHGMDHIVVQLAGVSDRDQAQALRGCEVLVDRSQFSTPAAGEIYWADLMGCSVVTADGIALGNVVDLVETGSNDVMIVQGDRERLIPFLREQTVKRVNLTAREIVVDWDPNF